MPNNKPKIFGLRLLRRVAKHHVTADLELPFWGAFFARRQTHSLILDTETATFFLHFATESPTCNAALSAPSHVACSGTLLRQG